MQSKSVSSALQASMKLHVQGQPGTISRTLTTLDAGYSTAQGTGYSLQGPECLPEYCTFSSLSKYNLTLGATGINAILLLK